MADPTKLTIDAALEVDGREDTTQLEVQGHTTQTEPLQAWQDHSGEALVQVTGDGRLQVGDLNPGTVDALVEADQDVELPSDRPKRAWGALGRIRGVVSDAITWIVHELELLDPGQGQGSVSGLQTALRTALTLDTSGDNDTAELRAADFEVINKSGSDQKPVGKITGLRVAVTNEEGAYLEKAYGLIVADIPETSGSEQERYAVHTGDGPVHLGDYLELEELSAVPGAPPASSGLVRIYPKAADGRLYAKNDEGTEYDLTGGGRPDDFFDNLVIDTAGATVVNDGGAPLWSNAS